MRYEIYIILDKKVQSWLVADEATADVDIAWAEAAGLPAVAIERDETNEVNAFSVTSACAGLYEALREYMLDM